MVKLGVKCPKCREGDLVEKRTRRGRPFYGCSLYPTCDFASWQRPVPTPCPACGGVLTEAGRNEVKCYQCGQTFPLEAIATGDAMAVAGR